jgi:hypothetical protein
MTPNWYAPQYNVTKSAAGSNADPVVILSAGEHEGYHVIEKLRSR